MARPQAGGGPLVNSPLNRVIFPRLHRDTDRFMVRSELGMFEAAELPCGHLSPIYLGDVKVSVFGFVGLGLFLATKR